jgi:hypothetical protein
MSLVEWEMYARLESSLQWCKLAPKMMESDVATKKIVYWWEGEGWIDPDEEETRP